MLVSPMRRLAPALLLLAVALVAGCSERLDSGQTCPALCPDQQLEITTAELTPVTLDSTLAGIVPVGEEHYLLLSSRGDTVETRAVIRFDTVDARAKRQRDTTTIPILKLDSAYLALTLDTTGAVAPQPIRLEAYDVDTTANTDSSDAPLIPLFRPDRFIGSLTFDSVALRDTSILNHVKLPLDTAWLRDRAVAGKRVRIGLRVTGAGSAQLRLLSAEAGIRPTLEFVAASPDTSVIAKRLYEPRSNTPDASDYTLNQRFRDRTIIVTPQPGAGSDLAVGGLPGRRSYLRFTLPDSIVDSATVTRAELILTQRPSPRSARDHVDSLTVYPVVVLAGAAVTDLARAAAITTNQLVTTDSLRLSPHDAKADTLDLTRLLRVWKGQKPALTPRALVLITQYEGSTPMEVRFWSSEAADPLLRPRLRISYIPRVNFGRP